jgi:hypothetical protein
VPTISYRQQGGSTAEGVPRPVLQPTGGGTKPDNSVLDKPRLPEEEKLLNINGAYAIYTVAEIEGTDCFEHKCLSWGYCTASHAWADLPEVASRNGISADDCIVLRWVDQDEAEELDEVEEEMDRRERERRTGNP